MGTCRCGWPTWPREDLCLRCRAAGPNRAAGDAIEHVEGWDQLRERAREMFDAFPPGEIWPFEAWLLAVCEHLEEGDVLGMLAFIDASGYRRRMSDGEIVASVRALPRLAAQLLAWETPCARS